MPPAALIEALRRIDPNVELFYVGEDMWWLGAVSRNSVRAERGQRILEFESQRAVPNPRNVFLGLLAQEGFARIEAYHGTDPSGTVVVNPGADNEYRTTILEDFRERDFNWRKDQGKAKVQERMEESLGEPERREAAALTEQYLATDGRAHFRREMKNRKVFGYAGETGGGGHIITLS